MKFIFSIILTLFLDNVFGETPNFQGVVKLITGKHKLYGNCINVGGTTVLNGTDWSKCKSDTVVFNFYKSPIDNSNIKRLSFYLDFYKSPSQVNLVETDYDNWLKPMWFKSDSEQGFSIFFVCKSQKGNWFEIIINEQTQETMWIKKNRFVKLLKWRTLCKKEQVCILPKSTIYSQPDTSLSARQFVHRDSFKIIAVKKDWMKMKASSGDDCINSLADNSTNWTIFRSRNQLFIELYFQDY